MILFAADTYRIANIAGVGIIIAHDDMCFRVTFTLLAVVAGVPVLRSIPRVDMLVEIVAELAAHAGDMAECAGAGVVAADRMGNRFLPGGFAVRADELAQTGGSGAIPYALLCEGEAFTRATFPEDGAVQVDVAIALEEWFSAAAGEYTDWVTFRVGLKEQEVAQ